MVPYGYTYDPNESPKAPKGLFDIVLKNEMKLEARKKIKRKAKRRKRFFIF